MNDLRKGLLIAGVSGVVSAIVAIVGHLLVVKENQVRLDGLERTVNELKTNQKVLSPMKTTVDDLQWRTRKLQDSLTSTKLFVAHVHPNQDIRSLAAMMKLENFGPKEFVTLGATLRDVITVGPNHKVVSAPEKLKALIAKYDLTGTDLIEYTAVANVSLEGS